MKSLSLIVTLFFAGLVHATPKVGDYAEFNYTISQAGQSMAGSMILAIVADQGATMTVTTNVHFDGYPDQNGQENAPKSELVNDEQIAAVLSNCASYGGANEQLVTRSGTFATCKLPVQDDPSKGYIWIGAVPFGVVKQIQIDGATTHTIELRKFINGQ